MTKEIFPKIIKRKLIERNIFPNGSKAEIWYPKKTLDEAKPSKQVILDFLDFVTFELGGSIRDEKEKEAFYALLHKHNPNSKVDLVRMQNTYLFPSYFLKYKDYEFEFASDGWNPHLKIKPLDNSEFICFLYDKVDPRLEDVAKEMIIELKKNGVRQKVNEKDNEEI